MYVVNFTEARVNFEEGTACVGSRTRSGRVASQDTAKQSPEKVRIFFITNSSWLAFYVRVEGWLNAGGITWASAVWIRCGPYIHCNLCD